MAGRDPGLGSFSAVTGIDSMIQQLIQCVQSFAGKRVLVVGDLILDRYVYGDAERISPEAPVPVLRVRERSEAAGGSANVAACLRALGLQVTCCGAVGDDPTGTQLCALLDELGADHCLATCGDRPTTAKTRFVGLAQHRHRQQLLRLDDESTEPLPAEAEAKLRKLAVEAIEWADVVCIEDYAKGVVTAGLVAAVVAAAKRDGKPVLVDPARLDTYERYRGATLLTPNRSELELVVGKRIETPQAAGAAACELAASLDVESVVVTLDRDGAVLARPNGEWVHLPTRARSVYDNTGAGDAVLAMLAAAVAVTDSREDAVRLANIAGGLEVERFGCVPITVEEVLAELRLEQGRRSGKLRSVEELVGELKLRRDRGETIAFTNGCFDLLHPGHVDYLARSRELASVLVVGLNSDRSIHAQGKGADRPLCDEKHRAAMLGALESVDYVVLFDDHEPEGLIRRIAPDVLIKGEDWANKGVVGREFVESRGGRVVLLPLVKGYSTTELVERIRAGTEANAPG